MKGKILMPGKNKTDKEKVIAAIVKQDRRVTTADVAASTGLSLSESNLLINQIAADTAARLDVSQSGNITYVFAANFQSYYLSRGLKAFGEKFGRLVFGLLFLLLKISFGLILLASLAIVLTAMLTFAFVIQMGSKQRRPKPLINLAHIRELIFWGKRGTVVISENRNFLLNCFSFLFGDGNAQNLEEQQWQLIAQLIQANDGVIVAEQVAPYRIEKNKNNDHDAMFDILCRFAGHPEVSDSGNIVYVFPSLKTNQLLAMPKASLQEKKLLFSNLGSDEIKPVLAIAILNLTGALWLAFTAHRIFRMYQWQVDLLVIYGSLFVIIPFLRWCWLKWANARLQKRNEQRDALASNLLAPPDALQQKLNERLQIELRHQQKEPDTIVYSTEE